MKILHIDITGPYTEGATYQENILPAEHVKLGHEVVLWASAYEWNNGIRTHVGELRKTMNDGVVLQRLDYKWHFGSYITGKVRDIAGIYERLVDEEPDLIMLHDGQTAIVPEVCRYVRNHHNVRLIADSHTDYLNSGTNWISRKILHGIYYRKYMRMLYDHTDIMYCISPEVKEYISELYGLDKEKMQLLPLGGIIPDDDKYFNTRKNRRDELKITDDMVHFVHSGKLLPEKKTGNLLQAFSKLNNDRVRLTIIGSAQGEVLKEIEDYASNDDRINWLGWKSGDELLEYLCSGDIYVLPGDQSATVQSSMCCRNAVVVYPYDNYKVMNLSETCYAENVEELTNSVRELAGDKEILNKARYDAYSYAKEWLDYSIQAKRIINTN